MRTYSYEVDRNPLNDYKVRREQWHKWTLVAKHVFNKTYSHMVFNPDLYIFPFEGKDFDEKKWKVIAWNAAFQAASVCTRGEIYLIKEVREADRKPTYMK